ncbi:hypothetical protein DSL72_001789 [Monilinia vaccinii-corymbosi]|uniref:Uncharacterized protein n=1 Tax=Monilinia vaccinii-corymbosi TaxID=61207 RepID=A0A8A3PAU7_9HELO|nr:hypothetical protein DSL72_001789 [Monilinia vaccinii-corymbosi]
MRSSTVAFAVTLALANSASALAFEAYGAAPTLPYQSPPIFPPVPTGASAPPPDSPHNPVYPTGAAYPSGSWPISNASSKPGVYSNTTILSTATASKSGAGTSTATAVTSVTGTGRTGPSASPTASATASNSAADALSLSGASWSVGGLMLGGMAVVFGFF